MTPEQDAARANLAARAIAGSSLAKAGGPITPQMARQMIEAILADETLADVIAGISPETLNTKLVSLKLLPGGTKLLGNHKL